MTSARVLELHAKSTLDCHRCERVVDSVCKKLLEGHCHYTGQSFDIETLLNKSYVMWWHSIDMSIGTLNTCITFFKCDITNKSTCLTVVYIIYNNNQ